MAQATALGFDPPRVLVPHPVRDRTDDELIQNADAVVEQIIAALMIG